jgi:hypothetical protein
MYAWSNISRDFAHIYLKAYKTVETTKNSVLTENLFSIFHFPLHTFSNTFFFFVPINFYPNTSDLESALTSCSDGNEDSCTQGQQLDPDSSLQPSAEDKN